MSTAFVITPFSPERAGNEDPSTFKAVQDAIAAAVSRNGLRLMHPAHQNEPGFIMKQVAEAIDDATVVIALLTGQNPNVLFELGWSRRPAILVARSAADVPFDLRHHRFWTYGDEGRLATLASDLESAVRATLASAPRKTQALPIFQAPPMPAHFVHRDREHEAARRALGIVENGRGAGTRTVLLHGSGGAGKSALARALAHDPLVQERFRDGILWMPMAGAELKQRLSDWGRALNDPHVTSAGYADAQTGVSQLRSLLHDRACLLIVDNVTQDDDLDSLLLGGPHCGLVVTSRFAAVADALGADIVNVDSMREADAWSLIEHWTGGVSRDDEPIAKQMASEVGFLPLALELMCGRVNRLGSWADYRALWEQERVKALRRPNRSGPQHSVHECFEISLNALAPEARDRFLQLAIFPGRTPFPVSAAAALWHCRSSEAMELLVDFEQQAILKRDREQARSGFLLHDLLRDVCGATLGGERLRQANRALLDGYRQTCQAGWPTLSDDGYILDHLIDHLLANADTDEVHRLIGDLRWVHARVGAGQGDYAGFLADVSKAWSVAEHAESTLSQLVHSFRCAVITTGVNSLTEGYEPEVVREAVRRGLWTANRALTAATHAPDPRRAARLSAAALASGSLTTHESERATQLGLSAAQRIGNSTLRAQALAELAAVLSPPHREQALNQAIAIITDEAPHFASLMYPLIAPELDEPRRRALYLAILARARLPANRDLHLVFSESFFEWLPGDVIPVLVDTLLESSRDSRYDDLATVGMHVNESLVPRLLEEVPSIPERKRPYYLLSLAHASQGNRRRDLVDNAWRAVADMTPGSSWKLAALTRLFPLLSREQQANVVAEIEFDPSNHVYQERTTALAAIAAHVHTSEQHRLLSTAAEWAISSGQGLLNVVREVVRLSDHALAERLFRMTHMAAMPHTLDAGLSGLAKLVSDESLSLALRASISADEEWPLGIFAATIGELLPEDTRQQLQQHALDVTFAIAHRDHQMAAMDALLPRLNEQQRTDAWARARSITDKVRKAEILGRLALSCTSAAEGPLQALAVDAACAIDDGRQRIPLLTALFPVLNAHEYRRVLTYARSLPDHEIEDVVVSIARHLPPTLHREAVRLAAAVSGPQNRIRMLHAIAQCVPQGERDAIRDLAADTATEFVNSGDGIGPATAEAIVWCAPESALPLLIDCVAQDESPIDAVEVLTAIARRTAEPVRDVAACAAVEILCATDDVYWPSRDSWLPELISVSGDSQQSRLLDWALKQPDPLEFLATFAGHAHPALVDVLHQSARAMAGDRDEPERYQKGVLRLIASLLPRVSDDKDRAELVALARDVCQRISDADARTEMVLAIARSSAGSQRRQCLEDLLQLIPAVRWNKAHRLVSASALLDDDALLEWAVELACSVPDRLERSKAIEAFLLRVPPSRRLGLTAEWLRAHESSRRSEFLAACCTSLFRPEVAGDALSDLTQVGATLCFDWKWP